MTSSRCARPTKHDPSSRKRGGREREICKRLGKMVDGPGEWVSKEGGGGERERNMDR
jgi:hypothetical protein